MQAYQLRAKLTYLTLAGYDNKEKELEWIGTREQWRKVEEEERQYEEGQTANQKDKTSK